MNNPVGAFDRPNAGSRNGTRLLGLVLFAAYFFYSSPQALAVDEDPYERLWSVINATELRSLDPSTPANVLSSDAIKNAKVKIVVFWASWCPNCLSDLVALKKLSAEYKPGDIEIIAISVEKDEAEAKKFVKTVGQYPPSNKSLRLLYSPGEVLPEKLKIPALPTTSVLDRDNRILGTYTGFTTGTNQYIRRRIFRVLKYGNEGT